MSGKEVSLNPSPVDQLITEASYRIDGVQELAGILVSSAIEHATMVDQINRGNYYPSPGEWDSSHQRVYSQGFLGCCYETLDSLGSVDGGWANRIHEISTAQSRSK